MILIISENIDYFTDQVISWINYYGFKEIFRFNEDDFINILEIDIKNEHVVIEVNNKKIDLSEVDFLWYRRGNLKLFPISLGFKDFDISNQVNKFLSFEWKICRDFIFYILQQKKSLGNFFKGETNKLINLNIAQKCGFDIPDTIISSESIVLSNFCKNNQTITKPIGEAMPIQKNNKSYRLFTETINNENIECNDTIFPTLVQNKIDKEFEIRIFIVYKEIFAIAIFSQNNEKTNTDFRNYDQKHMNRMIPYKLPDEIKQKILLFMNKAELDTGSIDMIKTYDNKYIFLEVNPCGNIEMTSFPYNYSIEKKIAEIIIDKVKNGK